MFYCKGTLQWKCLLSDVGELTLRNGDLGHISHDVPKFLSSHSVMSLKLCRLGRSVKPSQQARTGLCAVQAAESKLDARGRRCRTVPRTMAVSGGRKCVE